jgi:hypothetical protein
MLCVLGNIRLGNFKDSIDLFLEDGRKILQKLLNCVTPLDMIKKRCDRDARACKTWHATLNPGVNRYGVHEPYFIINTAKVTGIGRNGAAALAS